MKIYNSSQIPTSQFRHLIEFVDARCPETTVMAHVVVEDGQPSDEHMEGYFREKHGTDPEAPSQVCIWLPPRGSVYPNTQQYHPDVRIRVTSFEEEFVVVLAHELRHVDQSWNGRHEPKGFDYERDAERFAKRMLAAYRKSLQTNPIYVLHGKCDPGERVLQPRQRRTVTARAHRQPARAAA